MEFQTIDVGILSVVPPVIAIALALLTKEVIFSLVLGIMSGILIYIFGAGIGITGFFSTTMDLMANKLGNNASMLLFLAMLGALVALITKTGGSGAYGSWAARKLKTKRSAGLVTALLGVLIFIDDYFNCLTVGTVMKPVTDKYRISREKLAYLIDATAAPVCVIAPISSWAASVISYYPTSTGITGMQAFVQAIPINLYAVLSIFMIIWINIKKNADFGPMARAEFLAEKNGVFDAPDAPGVNASNSENDKISSKGTVLDLVIPVILLVIFCIIAMLFYGGFWSEGKSLFEAFGDTDAGMALSLGGFGAIICCFFLYIPRKLITFTEFFAAITNGIKAMVPALIILTLAWTISGVCNDLLSTGEYVAKIVSTSNMPIGLIPAIMFACACALSFATGTSWGTFGILIPITIAVCDIVAPELSVISLAAVLSGSVFGDHCSPISDTTILSSTGAACRHIDHVATQIPYASTVAAACFIGYIIAGFIGKFGFALAVCVSLSSSTLILVALLLILPKKCRRAAS
jgi:Na+/H+ antiporter NhaC